ncbi:ribosomal-processing cysteine protease Prp [Bacillus carboniphilus]|uniref:Ribosomal processing cysteine protease Prp n=1 Tax=Bacillus carboniphilus TaxID=86663 RepID=A0ABY9JZ75_9BACI|nr:ribosomal-processing cysteine protease Prp [Bacillus carboniphilus]WLR44078.1 ribosomal-processing cysteine protease Prp [Bacillus carboniphilus]
MIRINVTRSEEGSIQSFVLEGHAKFDVHGQDIVCSAVSAISFGSINAVLSLTGVELEIDQGGEGGYLKCVIPDALSNDPSFDQVQLLFEGMLVSLGTIELDYGDYLKITDPKV